MSSARPQLEFLLGDRYQTLRTLNFLLQLVQRHLGLLDFLLQTLRVQLVVLRIDGDQQIVFLHVVSSTTDFRSFNHTPRYFRRYLDFAVGDHDTVRLNRHAALVNLHGCHLSMRGLERIGLLCRVAAKTRGDRKICQNATCHDGDRQQRS